MNARLPEVPENNATAEFGGGYVVGEGKYRVDWILTDDTDRICSHSWTLNARIGRKERQVEPGMSPGMVDEISMRKWTRGSKGANAEDGYRITVLMNVAPVLPRRVRLGGYDRVLLLSSLASLVERLPLRSVRLVAFSLDQQREIYWRDNFEPRDFASISQALNSLELGTVDYQVLKNRGGHLDLISNLINGSMQVKSDAIVFLGPKPWHFDKVQASALPERKSADPPFFYVQFRPLVAAATFQDTLISAVKQMGGKTFDVYSPADFADAIKDITKTLQKRRQPRSGS
jgi:hypothetical protein